VNATPRSLLALSLLATIGSHTSFAAPVVAGRADDFVDFFGVNTHMDETTGPYSVKNIANKSQVLLDVSHIGFRYHRTTIGFSNSTSQDNAQSRKEVKEAYERDGLSAFLIVGGATNGTPGGAYTPFYLSSTTNAGVQSIKDNYGVNGEACYAIEGENEYNVRVESYKSDTMVSTFNTSWGEVLQQQALGIAVRRNTLMMNAKPIVMPSVWYHGFQSLTDIRKHYEELGNVYNYATYGNLHFYPGVQKPDDRLQDHLNNIRDLNVFHPTAPTNKRSIAITEMGWQAKRVQPLATAQAACSQAKMAQLMAGEVWLRRSQIHKALFYQAADSGYPTNGGIVDDGHGIFINNDGITRRPAFTAFRSLFSYLSEATWNRTTKIWVKPTFTPGSLDYTVSNSPDDADSLDASEARHILLKRTDQRYYILCWRNAVIDYEETATSPNRKENWMRVNVAPKHKMKFFSIPNINTAGQADYNYQKVDSLSAPVAASNVNHRLPFRDYIQLIEITLVP
jgi:hypothetical protein